VIHRKKRFDLGPTSFRLTFLSTNYLFLKIFKQCAMVSNQFQSLSRLCKQMPSANVSMALSKINYELSFIAILLRILVMQSMLIFPICLSLQTSVCSLNVQPLSEHPSDIQPTSYQILQMCPPACHHMHTVQRTCRQVTCASHFRLLFHCILTASS
jgi:hypothetical protein